MPAITNPPERTALIRILVERILRDNAEAMRLLAEHDHHHNDDANKPHA